MMKSAWNAVLLAVLAMARIAQAQLVPKLPAQGAIPECRNNYSSLAAYPGAVDQLKTLVTKDCPNIHNGVWINGPGTTQADGGAACNAAWTGLSANGRAPAAAKEFVTRNCPSMYMSLGWRSGPSVSTAIPACVRAFNDLQALGKLTQVGNAVQNRCQPIFSNGWLVQTAGPGPACDAIWSGLTAGNALVAARELVTHNCPWLYDKGYATPGSPIVP